jgi:hypothetical protein
VSHSIEQSRARRVVEHNRLSNKLFRNGLHRRIAVTHRADVKAAPIRRQQTHHGQISGVLDQQLRDRTQEALKIEARFGEALRGVGYDSKPRRLRPFNARWPVAPDDIERSRSAGVICPLTR